MNTNKKNSRERRTLYMSICRILCICIILNLSFEGNCWNPKEIGPENFGCGVGKDMNNMTDSAYMDLYAHYLKDMDIVFSAPTNFRLKEKSTDKVRIFSPNPDYKSTKVQGLVGGGAYAPAYFSEKNDAMILYPVLINYDWVCPDYKIEGELFAAYSDDALDCTPYVHRFQGNGLSPETNVDWIIMYEFENPVAVDSVYTHCVGIALRKRNHFAMPIKLLLTEEGLKNKEQYIKSVLGSVKYGDNTQPEWIEAENAVNWEEGRFPLKRWESRGIRNN